MMEVFRGGVRAAVLLTAIAMAGCDKAPDAGTGAPAGEGTAATAPAADGMRAIATPKELMQAIVIPSSDVVFKLAGEGPKSDDDWQTVRVQALALAESANLLMMPGRGPDAATWNEMSKAMMDAALDAVKAADGRSLDALDTASNTIYESCDTCHNKYMQK